MMVKGGLPGDAGSTEGVTVTVPAALGTPNLMERFPKFKILLAGLNVFVVARPVYVGANVVTLSVVLFIHPFTE